MTDVVIAPEELSPDLPTVIGTTPEEVQLVTIIDADFLPVVSPDGLSAGLLEVEDPPDEGEGLTALMEQDERDLLEQQYLASGQSLK